MPEPVIISPPSPPDAPATVQPSTMTSETKASHNTAHLPRRILNDLLSALCASTLVAPLITVIDKSIILRTHSQSPLRTILTTSITTALRHPLAFLTSTPYLLINTLYFSTYTAANLADTATSTLQNKPAGTVTPGTTKFVATSATNLSVCLYKDAQFARFFGAGSGSSAVKKVVPKTTLALFAVRDCMTIFASFNVPPLLAPFLGSQNAAQFLAPASMQLFSTPLHLLGLDLYNRPRGQSEWKGLTLQERWGVVKRDWLGASFARMGRIVPAYGVGGVVNSGIRKRLMAGLE